MKKLILLLVIVTFPFLTSLKLASAASDCGNIFLASFNNAKNTTDDAVNDSLGASGDTTTPDSIAHLNSRFIAAQMTTWTTVLSGTIGKCTNTSSTVGEFLKQGGTPGLAQNAASGMVTAFFSGPSSDIGTHYAEMLLPKEFVNQGGTAYAAAECNDGNPIGLTRPPKCQSASTYWSAGLGLSKMWGASFSIAMAIVVLVLIISGFLIMFRSKVGGQVVVTVSMALQNVILASIMALASFALGVFFVNLSKVLVLIVGNILLTALWTNMPGLALNIFGIPILDASQTVGSFLGTTYISDPLGLAAKLILVLFAGDLKNVQGVGSGLISMGQSFSSTFGPIITTLASVGGIFVAAPMSLGLAIIYLIVRLIIMGALLVVSIRIVWTVIKVYIKMAIDVVIAPVLFVVSAIPGKSNAVSDWLMRMFKNAIIPPLMFALVNVTVYIVFALAVGAGSGAPAGGYDPITAVTGGALPPSSIGLAAFAIGPHAIVMLVLLNMVPTIPAIVEDLFSGKSSGSVEKATGEMMKSLQKIPVAGALFN